MAQTQDKNLNSSSHSLSIRDLEYITKTPGWLQVLVPYWTKHIQRQLDKIRSEERNLREGKESKIQYELGKLDGYRTFFNSVDNIMKGFKIRTKSSV